MDLPSHLSFGLAIGLVFFGNNPEIVLLIGLGTLIPDLDREYWYVRRQVYAEEQYHRARFHNVFMILIGYLVNPFFSLGNLPPHATGFLHDSEGQRCRMVLPANQTRETGNVRPDYEPEKARP